MPVLRSTPRSKGPRRGPSGQFVKLGKQEQVATPTRVSARNRRPTLKAKASLVDDEQIAESVEVLEIKESVEIEEAGEVEEAGEPIEAEEPEEIEQHEEEEDSELAEEVIDWHAKYTRLLLTSRTAEADHETQIDTLEQEKNSNIDDFNNLTNDYNELIEHCNRSEERCNAALAEQEQRHERDQAETAGMQQQFEAYIAEIIRKARLEKTQENERMERWERRRALQGEAIVRYKKTIEEQKQISREHKELIDEHETNIAEQHSKIRAQRQIIRAHEGLIEKLRRSIGDQQGRIDRHRNAAVAFEDTRERNNAALLRLHQKVQKQSRRIDSLKRRDHSREITPQARHLPKDESIAMESISSDESNEDVSKATNETSQDRESGDEVVKGEHSEDEGYRSNRQPSAMSMEEMDVRAEPMGLYEE